MCIQSSVWAAVVPWLLLCFLFQRRSSAWLSVWWLGLKLFPRWGNTPTRPPCSSHTKHGEKEGGLCEKPTVSLASHWVNVSQPFVIITLQGDFLDIFSESLPSLINFYHHNYILYLFMYYVNIFIKYTKNMKLFHPSKNQFLLPCIPVCGERGLSPPLRKLILNAPH